MSSLTNIRLTHPSFFGGLGAPPALIGIRVISEGAAFGATNSEYSLSSYSSADFSGISSFLFFGVPMSFAAGESDDLSSLSFYDLVSGRRSET